MSYGARSLITIWSIILPVATFIFNSGFQCFVPGVTNCLRLPGTFLVSAMKFPSLRKPLSPGKLEKVVYPNCTERTIKNDNWGGLHGSSQLDIFLPLLSHPCSVESTRPPQSSPSISAPTTLFLPHPPRSSKQISQICSVCLLGYLSLQLFWLAQ